MSERASIITVKPRKNLLSCTEFFMLCGFECPQCNGSGQNKQYHGYHGSNKESELTECKYCEGIGTIKALVSIDWAPDKPNNAE